MPDRKDNAETISDADRRFLDADPQADLARGAKRPETDPREKIQHKGDILHEDFDPDEIDPGTPPRTPI